MQNTNFVYHPESLLEMQIMVCAAIYYIGHYSDKAKEYPELSNNQGDFILLFLLSEHFFSYCVAYYRAWDIDENG